jgi:hypothetical protein
MSCCCFPNKGPAVDQGITPCRLASSTMLHKLECLRIMSTDCGHETTLFSRHYNYQNTTSGLDLGLSHFV